MAASKVYFTDLHTTPSLNLLKKLEQLVTAAGFNEIDFDRKMTALKIHFGEPGNLSYLRPNFAERIASMVKKKGGKPYLTDCNTLYYGRRSNAPDHLEAAFANGFNPLSTGCHVIIADGVKGSEYSEIEINKEFTQKAKIGAAIASADVIISLNHFKGHEQTGFGGAIKNLGMGCASVGGKLFLHSGNPPEVAAGNCTGCGMCEQNCAHDAIHVEDEGVAVIDLTKCAGCGQCVAVCQFDAARVVWGESAETLSKKIAEYAMAAINNKPALHINFIMNVSPDCDCWGHNDVPLVADIGIAASTDPVALDKACADMVNHAPAYPGSKITPTTANDLAGEDKFDLAHPSTNWRTGLLHAEKIGMGSLDYEIIKV